jgi:hypothetical protein
MAQPSKENHPAYNLDTAYGIIRERMSKVDVLLQCKQSGATLQPDSTVKIKYLNQAYLINTTNAAVSFTDTQQDVPMRDKILILHYFTQAKGTALTGKQITYRDLPGGLVYYPTFMKRTINPIADNFGKDAPLLLRAGKLLGARQTDYGDVSIVIDVFARVPITIILWQGDDELTPQVNLLFDASISDYLESEDVTIVCESITWHLVNLIRQT